MFVLVTRYVIIALSPVRLRIYYYNSTAKDDVILGMTLRQAHGKGTGQATFTAGCVMGSSRFRCSPDGTDGFLTNLRAKQKGITSLFILYFALSRFHSLLKTHTHTHTHMSLIYTEDGHFCDNEIEVLLWRRQKNNKIKDLTRFHGAKPSEIAQTIFPSSPKNRSERNNNKYTKFNVSLGRKSFITLPTRATFHFSHYTTPH